MLTTNFIFQFQQKNTYITFTLKEPFFQGEEKNNHESILSCIRIFIFIIMKLKFKKKWFPLGFISLFNTVWMLWFLFISIILHFIGDIPFLLQFNTLLTLELRPRGDPDTSLKNVKWQSTRRTLQQHNGIFFVFLATLEAVKLALDKNSKRVCVQWNSIECGYICSTVLKNWSTVQFTSLWKLRKNSRIIAKNGTIGHLTSWFYSHEI